MENLSFKRGRGVKQALDIGIKHLVWFGGDNSNLEANDGINDMWIDEDFMESIMDIKHKNKTSPYGTYRTYNEIDESFNKISRAKYGLYLQKYGNDKWVYVVVLYSGFTIKAKKELYKRLYLYLLEKI